MTGPGLRSTKLDLISVRCTALRLRELLSPLTRGRAEATRTDGAPPLMIASVAALVAYNEILSDGAFLRADPQKWIFFLAQAHGPGAWPNAAAARLAEPLSMLALILLNRRRFVAVMANTGMVG
jgi:hypothetical protein